jgi:hypothetical protein
MRPARAAVDLGRVSRRLPLTMDFPTRQDPKLISISHQPVPIAASRCYLIQMLRCALTCTNGCSCWSPDEENSPLVFPYHGCALPTELGGQVIVSQLGTDIVSTTPMKRPINRAPISIQRRRCYRITAASNQPKPSSAAHPAPSTATLLNLARQASRHDRAAAYEVRPGNPVAPDRICEP